MKKQKTIDFSRLLPEQINFIKNKIEELGSLEAVQAFYNKHCTVDLFARKIAKDFYKSEPNAVPAKFKRTK